MLARLEESQADITKLSACSSIPRS